MASQGHNVLSCQLQRYTEVLIQQHNILRSHYRTMGLIACWRTRISMAFFWMIRSKRSINSGPTKISISVWSTIGIKIPNIFCFFSQPHIHLDTDLTVLWSVKQLHNLSFIVYKLNHQISRVSCQKGSTCHTSAWQVGTFWQDTIDIC